jgi:hypothetical protein
MASFRLISIFSILQAGFVSLGYLTTELCITVFYGRDEGPFPRIVVYATEYWWAFMAATVLWAVYAVCAQSKIERRIFSTYLPYGLGLLLLLSTFLLYLLAIAVATWGPPYRLAG